MRDSQSRWIGRDLVRREDEALLEGKGRFLGDVTLSGVVYVTILRSPHAHARIRRIDVARAEAVAGVLTVVTGDDVARVTRPFPTTVPSVRPVMYHALATDTVRAVGEPVAAVVTENRLSGEDVIELIDVDYDPLPVVANVEAALASGSERVYSHWPDNVLTQRSFSAGDPDRCIEDAEIRVTGEFVSQRQTALPLELRGCMANYEGGRLTVWSSTQVPHLLRTVLADVLGASESTVRVIAPEVGGGFGVKFQIYREDALVAFLAKRLRRPVRWREDIREHLSSAVHARDQRVTIDLGARADGVVVGLKVDVVGDVGTGAAFPSSYGPVLVLATGFALGLRVEDFAYRYTCVTTNKNATGAYRGFGNPVRVFTMERALDMLAAKTGLDPADVRRRNLVRQSDMPYRAATGARLETGTLVEALDRALEMADYQGRRREQEEARRQGRYLGVGMASFAEGTAPSFIAQSGMFGGFDQSKVEIALDGTVTVTAGVAPQGQGHETMIAQIVADGLGVSPASIVVKHSDTSLGVFGQGAWASRTGVVAGGAASLAAGKLQQKILDIAAHELEADRNDLRVAEGIISVVGMPNRSISFREVARAAYAGRGRLPVGMEPGLDATAWFEPPAIEGRADSLGRAMRYATIANAAHVAVVEVEADTGIVKILDYVVVHDCGKVINPMIVDGQIRGGVAQGIAGVLHEQIVYDDHGQLLTGTLMDYHVPKAADIPNIRIAHLESPDPYVPNGVKGVGEGGTIGAAAAVANAVADALLPLGVQVTQTLLTPPEIVRLIDRAGNRRIAS